jgi:hypothetical protein
MDASCASASTANAANIAVCVLAMVYSFTHYPRMFVATCNI